MDIKKEFEKKFGIEPHHEETCMKALDKLKRDMEKLKCDDGDGRATNPIAEKAITFFRYYEDITSWIQKQVSVEPVVKPANGGVMAMIDLMIDEKKEKSIELNKKKKYDLLADMNAQITALYELKSRLSV